MSSRGKRAGTDREPVSAELERLRTALRYIAGWDVPGYPPHLRPESVAIAALGYDGNPATHIADQAEKER